MVSPSQQLSPYVATHQSVSLLPFIVFTRQRLVKRVPEVKNTGNNKISIGRVIFCSVCALAEESLCIPYH
jgi:hypothetical protein